MKVRRSLSSAVFLLGMLAATSLVGAVDVWGSGTPGIYFVTDFYVHGDGINDDTAAFQGAIDAARDAGGGAVIVPPVGGGKGYVLEGTVTVWQSVALIGSLAGFSSNGWAAYSQSESHVVGAKILARPKAEKAALFQLEGGNTVRGFWIFYDKQPWPTDAEFQTKGSGFYYETLDKARDPVAGFIQTKVLACGPTFYVTMGDNTCLEDIICDRYYDFFYLKAGARVSVNRIALYGYKRGFVIEKSLDVNRLSNIELVTGVGPVTLGNDLCYKCGDNCLCVKQDSEEPKCLDCRSYSWMYGIIVAQEDNIGVQIGRSDGYTLTNVFFDAVHTGIRLGASDAWPLWEPVLGRNVDLNYLYPLEDPVGPWGSMSNIGVDGCNVGLQFVMPGGIATHISNLLVYPQYDDGKKFTALYGTGDLEHVSRHTAIIFEDTYRHESYSGGPVPALLISNAEIGSSWPENRAIAGVGASMCTANGRVFLVAGEATVEISGLALALDVPKDRCGTLDPKSLLIATAAAAGAGGVSVRIRGYILNGRPESDWAWANVLSPWPLPFP